MTLFPNAKINIGLDVIAKRTDGYHNIETVFYPIPLCDTIEILPVKNGKGCAFSTSGIDIGSAVGENLIEKAYHLLEKECGALPPVKIYLDKKIPFGAGLGGGSADAAFTLKGLNEMLNLQLSTEKLEKLAACLGADCAVFIQNKPVFASGIGNEFTSVDLSLADYYLLLVKPDIHVSTPQAYAKVTPQKPEISLLENIKQPIEKWKTLIKNDFEKSVFAAHPRIAEIKEKLYDLGAIYAAMSGSGSAVFGLFDRKITTELRIMNYELKTYYLQLL